MKHSEIMDAGARALSIALRRWQNEVDAPAVSSAEINAVLPDSISHCLVNFQIDSMVRVDIANHTAPLPISEFWIGDVTLWLVLRPAVPTPLAEIRAASNPLIAHRRFAVKWFKAGDWLVMPHDFAEHAA